MATQARYTPGTLELIRALQNEPYRFDFFYALRCLENAHRDRPRIGHSLEAKGDVVRLTQEPSLSFAPSTIASYDPPDSSGRGRLAVYFFGLLGPNGPLPLHLTDYALRRRDHHDDPTFLRFLDWFHHRMLSLFYRAWASAEPAVSLDRPDDDRFAMKVGALFGLGMPSLTQRDAMPDSLKFHFAGRLACQTRNAEGLTAILAGFFGLPVRIVEFVGQWLRIPRTNQWRLGDTRLTGSLGATTVVGEHVWDCQSKFRIVMGPMDPDDYARFLPGSDGLRRLAAIVRNYVGDEMTWDLNLVLRRERVPGMSLGGSGRLGWTSWVKGEHVSLGRDGNDLFLDPFTGQAA